MRGFNIWTAVITGVPLAALVAYGEANPTGEGNWFIFSATVTLSAILLGVPQGFLAGIRVFHRGGWWRRAVLLGLMTIAGVVLTVLSWMLVIRTLPSMAAPEPWVLLPSPSDSDVAPPQNVTTLVAPICAGRVSALPGRDDPNSATAYVITDTGHIFRLDGWADPYEVYVLGRYHWVAVDALPAPNCAEPVDAHHSLPLPAAEVARVAVHRWSVDCSEHLQVALSDDGRLWRSAQGSCAGPDIGRLVAYVLLSPVLSLAAWVAVVVRLRKSRPKSV